MQVPLWETYWRTTGTPVFGLRVFSQELVGLHYALVAGVKPAVVEPTAGFEGVASRLHRTPIPAQTAAAVNRRKVKEEVWRNGKILKERMEGWGEEQCRTQRWELTGGGKEPKNGTTLFLPYCLLLVVGGWGELEALRELPGSLE